MWLYLECLGQDKSMKLLTPTLTTQNTNNVCIIGKTPSLLVFLLFLLHRKLFQMYSSSLLTN